MKLLVPLDGSNLSEIVFPWVKLLGSEVELVRSYLPAGQLHLTTGLTAAVEGLVNDHTLPAAIEAYLKEQAEKIAPLPCAIKCVAGNAPEVILDHSHKFDAIVMASHGLSGISRWLLGGVTTKVVRASDTPVLVVSAKANPVTREAKIERIFVPLDGSQTAEVALQKAVKIAQKHGSTIILYEGVVYRHGTPLAEDWQAISAKEYLTAFRESLSHLDVEIVVHESRIGPEIVEQADKHDADMIVMGSHGRSGVSRLFLGSVTEGVVQRANCPVLIVYNHS